MSFKTPRATSLLMHIIIILWNGEFKNTVYGKFLMNKDFKFWQIFMHFIMCINTSITLWGYNLWSSVGKYFGSSSNLIEFKENLSCVFIESHRDIPFSFVYRFLYITLFKIYYISAVWLDKVTFSWSPQLEAGIVWRQDYYSYLMNTR